jgi:hypothetical protein
MPCKDPSCRWLVMAALLLLSIASAAGQSAWNRQWTPPYHLGLDMPSMEEIAGSDGTTLARAEAERLIRYPRLNSEEKKLWDQFIVSEREGRRLERFRFHRPGSLYVWEGYRMVEEATGEIVALHMNFRPRGSRPR